VSDPLEALLQRCHRDELEPLARLVGVNPPGLGFGELARITAATLRRRASHDLRNIVLRRGEGPPYEEILLDVAARAGAAVPKVADAAERLVATELAVVRAAIARAWVGATAEARATMWATYGMAGDPPDHLDEWLARDERGFGYRLATTFERVPASTAGLGVLLATVGPWGCVTRMFAPIAILYYLMRPDPDRALRAVLQVARLRQIVTRRVTVGVVGSPSTGKDAAIRALFGIETGNISPIAGSTREVSIQRLPTATALYVVNTPGMGDVVERVTEEARQVIDHIDVYLYLVNAEGGVQRRELDDYQRCVATGKPVLAIVNKVDVLRPRDRDAYLVDARAKLGAAEQDFAAVAFDPLPQLAAGPINVEAVRAWLRARLVERGKDPDELPSPPDALRS
jgi:GTP-binding protein EngB required for normal cell division